MKKSLQEIIRESEDKYVDLLQKIEDSYVLRGLDWVDKKLSLKEYFPQSRLAKAFDFPRDLVLYGIIGMIPSEKQEKYAEYLGYDKLKFTKYSILYGACLSAGKLGIAAASPFSFLSWGIGVWGLITLADTIMRIGYVCVTKKPVGSFIYTEWPYNLVKHLFKKKEKACSIKVKSLDISVS